MAQLTSIDGLHDAVIRKRGKRILEVISRSTDDQSAQYEVWRPPLRSDPKVWAAALGEAVAAAALQLGVAPEILFAGKDIERLIQSTLDRQSVPEDLFGWRDTVITQQLITLLASLMGGSRDNQGTDERSS
jgi:ribonuclease D